MLINDYPIYSNFEKMPSFSYQSFASHPSTPGILQMYSPNLYLELITHHTENMPVMMCIFILNSIIRRLSRFYFLEKHSYLHVLRNHLKIIYLSRAFKKGMNYFKSHMTLWHKPLLFRGWMLRSIAVKTKNRQKVPILHTSK